MDDETKSAVDALHTRVTDIEAHLAIGAKSAFETLDETAIRTLAEARAVLDEYYGTFLNKVRVELGLPVPRPIPVQEPVPAISAPVSAPATAG